MESFVSFSYLPLLAVRGFDFDFLQMTTMAPMTRINKMQIMTKKELLFLLAGGSVVRNTQSSDNSNKIK